MSVARCEWARCVVALMVGFAVAIPARLAFASATGLNNIPTADVVGEREVVLQQWSDYGSNQVPEHFVGVKAGPVRNLEVGLDAKVGSSSLKRGPVVFQGKYRLELDDRLAVAAGVANLAWNTKQAGKVFPYAVATGDLGWFRAHVGYEAQEREEGPFAGVDRSFAWWDRTTLLRADILPVNQQRHVLWSAGLLQELTEHLVLETWYNGSNDTSRNQSVTVKLNAVWQF